MISGGKQSKCFVAQNHSSLLLWHPSCDKRNQALPLDFSMGSQRSCIQSQTQGGERLHGVTHIQDKLAKHLPGMPHLW